MDLISDENNTKEKQQYERYFLNYNKEYIKENIENMSLEDFELFSEIRKNILSWYEFNNNAEIIDLNPNFGEISEYLCDISKNVTIVSDSKIKYEALLKRLKDKNNVTIYKDFIPEKKYDYVVIIGIDNKNELTNKIGIAKDLLKNDGKIIVAFNNKLGMQYWTGKKESNENEYDRIIGNTKAIGINELTKFLDGNNLKYKVYYALPDYKLTNVIYSESYLPDSESINSRDITYSTENGESYEFCQRKAYNQILKENKEYFKIFSNSYFIEIAKEEIKNSVRYVNFETYRSEKYNIKTIIEDEYVYKSANSLSGENHIDSIKKNIDKLSKYDIKKIETYVDNRIVSKFIKNSISLDKKIIEEAKTNEKTFIFEKLDEFIEKTVKKINVINKPITTIFDKYQIKVQDYIENDDKFNYVRDGLIDLLPQNCFVINDEFYIYDQEWYEENVPVEFIYYRIIFYYHGINKLISKQELYDYYKITPYINLFEELENRIQNSIRNQYVWKLHINSVNKVGEKNRIIAEEKKKNEDFNSKIEDLSNKIEDLCNKIEIETLNNKTEKEALNNKIEIETLNNKTEKEALNSEIKKLESEIKNINMNNSAYENMICEYQRQLKVIETSLSWRLTKPLRYLSEKFRRVRNILRRSYIKNKLIKIKTLLITKINSTKEKIKKYNNITINYKKYTDEKTAKRWTDNYINEKYKVGLNSRNEYNIWIANNEPTFEQLEEQRNVKFEYNPKISIVVPLYNTPIEYFRDLIFFMHEQTYANWELCLADASEKMSREIKKAIEKEPKIKYKFLGANKGISENTNEALKMATGDYIGLLDHDDYLSMDCLYEVVKCINENQNVEFIYTDEDKTVGVGKERYDAFFKPGFAPDTLRSQNYICHFSVFKKDVMEKLEGFRKEFDGAQDYDIVLRMSEIVEAKNIKHIEKILYHWRMHKNSTAMAGSAKTWAFEAGRKAIEEHIKRIGLKGTVKNGRALGIYDVEYDVLNSPKVSILIPNKDGIEDLKICVNSILEKTSYLNYEIAIIENNSENKETFEYYEELKQNEKIKVLEYKEKGFNYSRIINFGVKNVDGDFIIQLNNDTELITSNWLEIMLGYCQRKEVGAVGIKLIYPDETIQHAGVLLGMGGIAGHFFKNIHKDSYGYFSKAAITQNMTAVTAACIMTRREIYEEVDFMNEELAVAFNDIDFCMKIRKAGYLIIYNPRVELWHYESKSRGDENTPEKVKRFNNEIEIFRKYWNKELEQGDPYYNKNLRLDNDQCAIKTNK